MSGIKITDDEQRAPPAVVRSLGRAGHEVQVCSSRARAFASTSRYAAASHMVADLLRDAEKFLADLTRVAAGIRADVLAAHYGGGAAVPIRS